MLGLSRARVSTNVGLLAVGCVFWLVPKLAAQQFYAQPNPIYTSAAYGATTIHVNAPNYAGHTLNIYVGSTPPFGQLFASGGSNFTANTGQWVTSGMPFFLVDANTGQTIDGLTAIVAPSFLGNDVSGCIVGPFTSCIDSVPLTHLGGPAGSTGGLVWTDTGSSDGRAEWNMTGNSGVPGSTSSTSGTVVVVPSNGCPWVTWQVSGTFSPSPISAGVQGSTNFTWTATNPNPSGTCNGWTPVSQMVYTGTIRNATNDVANGTWANSSGGTGSFAMFANPGQFPNGETTTADDFGPPAGTTATQLTFVQELAETPAQDNIDPNLNLFQGRQVFEGLTPGMAATDSCYAASGGLSPTPGAFAVNGSVWNIGSGASGTDTDEYRDTIGWTLASAIWYRNNLAAQFLPCTADFYQTMYMIGSDPDKATFFL